MVDMEQAQPHPYYEDTLSCLQQLIALAKQKQASLMERRHADLQGLVSQEHDLLLRLQQLQEERASGSGATNGTHSISARNPRDVAKMAAAIAELQQINRLNSSLIIEHLDSVEICLAMLTKAMNTEYAPAGSANGGNGKAAFRGIVDIEV